MAPPPLAGPPQLDAAGLTWAQVAARYRQTQLLLVKRLVQPQRGGDGGEGWGYGGLSALFAQGSGKAQIESSWNIEHGGPALTAPSVLGPAGQPAGDWYVSFILQDPSHGQSAPLGTFLHWPAVVGRRRVVQLSSSSHRR